MRKLTNPAFQFGKADAAALARDGYFIPDVDLLTPAGLAFCQQNVEATLLQLEPGRSPTAIFNAHQLPGGEWLAQLAADAALVSMVQQQIGPDAVLWNTDLVLKPPRGHGSVEEPIPYHQDRPYHRFSAPEAATIWLAIDPVGVRTGTMYVLPGLHADGVLPRRLEDADEPQFLQKREFTIEIDPKALPPNIADAEKPYILRPGQCALHSTMLPHRSGVNTSVDEWRRVIVLRYAGAGLSSRFGQGVYADYRNGAEFQREYVLVGGVDRMGRNMRRIESGTGLIRPQEVLGFFGDAGFQLDMLSDNSARL